MEETKAEKQNSYSKIPAIIGFIILAIGFLLISCRIVTEFCSTEFCIEDETLKIILIPTVAMGAALLALAAYLVQYQANQNIRKEFKSRQSNEHFYKMLDIHARHVENLTITSYRSEKDGITFKYLSNTSVKSKGSFSNVINYAIGQAESNFIIKPKNACKSHEVKKRGREVFQLLVKDFHLTVHTIDHYCKKRSICLESEKKLQLAYKFFFWGTDSVHHVYGNDIPREVVKEIADYLDGIRKAFRNNKGHKLTFTYQTIENPRELTMRFIPFSGHVIRLAHYYRYLYQIVKYLHNRYMDKMISRSELDANLDTLRALMTNEEQLLLYYNYRMGFGANWDCLGNNNYQFLSEYRMLHNIPLYDHIPEEMESPVDHWKDFIKEKKRKDPSFTLFEWFG